MMSISHASNIITINGAPYPLRLTLGALAEIEAAFGGDVATMQTRLKNPRIADLLSLLHALLIGGGGTLSFEALKASEIDVTEAANAIAKAFETLGSQAGSNDGPGKS